MAVAPPGVTVISGMRNNCEVVVNVNFSKAVEDGLRFYRSQNNVLLSDGINGFITPEYITTIQVIKDGQVLYGGTGLTQRSLVAQEITNHVDIPPEHEAEVDDYMYFWMGKSFLTPVYALPHGLGNELILDSADFIYVFTNKISSPDAPTIDARNRGGKQFESLQKVQAQCDTGATFKVIELQMNRDRCLTLLQESLKTRFDPQATDEELMTVTKELRQLVNTLLK